MFFFQTLNLTPQQKEALRQLWNKEYPLSIQHQTIADLDNYLSKLIDPHHILILDKDNHMMAWYCDFIRNEARWFAMIIDTTIQRKGYGSALLNKGKARHPILNGWIVASSTYPKADGSPYLSPKQFYEKQGFQIIPEERMETEALKTIKIRWTKY